MDALLARADAATIATIHSLLLEAERRQAEGGDELPLPTTVAAVSPPSPRTSTATSAAQRDSALGQAWQARQDARATAEPSAPPAAASTPSVDRTSNTRVCSTCAQALGKAAFSQTQWRRPRPPLRCRACSARAHPRLPGSHQREARAGTGGDGGGGGVGGSGNSGVVALAAVHAKREEGDPHDTPLPLVGGGVGRGGGQRVRPNNWGHCDYIDQVRGESLPPPLCACKYTEILS